jgi:hypothetical protein
MPASRSVEGCGPCCDCLARYHRANCQWGIQVGGAALGIELHSRYREASTWDSEKAILRHSTRKGWNVDRVGVAERYAFELLPKENASVVRWVFPQRGPRINIVFH